MPRQTYRRLCLFSRGALLLAAIPLCVKTVEASNPSPELVLQLGHASSVDDAAFSPDGRCMLTCSPDTTPILWDTSTGRIVRRFESHAKAVFAVAFSPDGRFVLTGSEDKTAILWETATGRRVRTFTVKTGWMFAVAFSPDGASILTGGTFDHAAFLWDVSSGKVLQRLEGHNSMVVALAFSPDGTRAVTGSNDNTAMLWDLETGERLHTFEFGRTDVTSVGFSEDGNRILTGLSDRDRIAVFWDAKSGLPVRTFQRDLEDAIATRVALSPGGRYLACVSVFQYNDEVLELWDTHTGRKVRTMRLENAVGSFIKFSPDSRHILTGSRVASAMLWEVDSGRLVRTFGADMTPINTVRIASQGQFLMSASADRATFWPTDRTGGVSSFRLDEDRSNQADVMTGHTEPVICADLGPSDRVLLTAARDNNAMLWDVKQGKLLHALAGHTDKVNAVAISPDGKLALTGSEDQSSKVWDVASGTLRYTLPEHEREVTYGAFSPDSRYVATGTYSREGPVVLYDLQSGQTRRPFLERSLRSLAFSPDGGFLVACTLFEDLALLWDLEADNQVRTFAGHNGPISSVAFSPDGEYLLTASWDRKAILWNVASGKRIHTFEGHGELISSAVFCPRGRCVLTGSSDGTCRLWDTQSGQELLRLIALNRGQDWLAVTLDGRVDGSPAGLERVTFRLKGKDPPVRDADLLKQAHQPGLLQKVWAEATAGKTVRGE
jgi:WD40 repeat protein